MPLAASYLKAYAYKNDVVKNEVDIEICNFGGAATSIEMVKRLVVYGIPDIVCFSVYGWNLHLFGRVIKTYRQFNPDGWVVFGGPHVTNQAKTIFRVYPEVDVIVNYEGEITFSEILEQYLLGKSKHDLFSVNGISYRDHDNNIITNPKRERMKALDEIPSPFLTGIMPLVNNKGEFKYDVALMETNRGCPYKCAFCFWGGAIGQKLSCFSLDRLQEEIEMFARLGVNDIVLCDANFGMSKQDIEFVEIL